MSEESIRYLEAIQTGYHEIFDEFDDVFVMGEDVESSLMNNTYRLKEEFGDERVRDTPISEQAFVGAGIGAAMVGKRPIVELQINPLALVAFEQIVNHAAKIHYMSDGAVSVPLTLTLPMAGSPGASGAQHSDNVYPSLVQYGLKTAIPSTPRDVKGLLRSAVLDDDPTVLLFPSSLYGTTGEVPEGPYEVPFGEAEVVRHGEDLTVVTSGETVRMATEVADERPDGAIEVIDLRSLFPLDETTVFESVAKTGRLLIVDDAIRTCGLAAEVAARVSNHCLWDLNAPIKRVTRGDVPIPYNPPQEQAVLPDKELVAEAVDDLLYSSW